jgi:hypothetical protein
MEWSHTRLAHGDVTGLVVNLKPNAKNEYIRLARAQCHSLFRKGYYTYDCTDSLKKQGSLNHLEGKLNFIDQIDRYNRLKSPKKKN